MSTNAEHRRKGLTVLAQALPPAVAAPKAAAGSAPVSSGGLITLR